METYSWSMPYSPFQVSVHFPPDCVIFILQYLQIFAFCIMSKFYSCFLQRCPSGSLSVLLESEISSEIWSWAVRDTVVIICSLSTSLSERDNILSSMGSPHTGDPSMQRRHGHHMLVGSLLRFRLKFYKYKNILVGVQLPQQ